MAKPRPPQGKIAALTDEQREKLRQWLQRSLSYTQIKALLQSEFGVSISSTALSEYYTRHGLELLNPSPKTIHASKEPRIDVRAVALTPDTEIQIRAVDGWISLRAVGTAQPRPMLNEEARN